MHVDKAKKLIAKQVKKGDKGYPKISLAYFGETSHLATEVAVQFILEDGAEVQEERFSSETGVKDNEVIQSALVKIIQRADAKSVIEIAGVSPINMNRP